MTTTFLNWKGPQGRETIDEISRASFPTFQAYRLELRRLISEYHLAGMACYSSSRPCARSNRITGALSLQKPSGGISARRTR